MKALILAAALISVAQGAMAADAKKGPDGKALFTAKCASCHGKDAKGSAAMAKMYKLDVSALNLADAKASDDELTKIVKAGKGKMPKFEGKLKDDEIAAVLSYVHSLGAAKKAAK
jgi:cbb3-type cytochrome c oxidase subunit III